MLPVEPIDDPLMLVALLEEPVELPGLVEPLEILDPMLELPIELPEVTVDEVEPEVEPLTGEGVLLPPVTGPVAGPPSRYCCM